MRNFYSFRETYRWFLTFISLQYIQGHGRMEEPPARNAAWRFGFDVPVNYDDVGLNCGGLSIQRANNGKCGVCGDAYTGPKYHEAGGKYATNIIVRHYGMGSMIDVKILITANHIGFMEFRLCPVLDLHAEVTQECLDENLLEIEGFGKQFLIQESTSSVLLKLHLPKGLFCSRCVLQWRYHAGNSWGTDAETGRSCLGCGLQEEFYNCADISISPMDHQPMSSVVVEDSVMDVEYDDLSTTRITSKMPNLFFPVDNANEFHPRKKILHCFPTNEALKPVIGIEKWCQHLCLTECPPTLCVCVEI